MRGIRFFAVGAFVAALATLAQAEQHARTTSPEHAKVRLILIGTIVTGERGRPVPGLTKDRFHLWIDGKDATIAAFEHHSQATASPEGPFTDVPIGGVTAGAAPAGICFRWETGYAHNVGITDYH